MIRCFTEFPISGLGLPNIYQNLVRITMCGGFTWRVSDCEELVGEVCKDVRGCELLKGGHCPDCVMDFVWE